MAHRHDAFWADNQAILYADSKTLFEVPPAERWNAHGIQNFASFTARDAMRGNPMTTLPISKISTASYEALFRGCLIMAETGWMVQSAIQAKRPNIPFAGWVMRLTHKRIQKTFWPYLGDVSALIIIQCPRNGPYDFQDQASNELSIMCQTRSSQTVMKPELAYVAQFGDDTKRKFWGVSVAYELTQIDWTLAMNVILRGRLRSQHFATMCIVFLLCDRYDLATFVIGIHGSPDRIQSLYDLNQLTFMLFSAICDGLGLNMQHPQGEAFLRRKIRRRLLRLLTYTGCNVLADLNLFPEDIAHATICHSFMQNNIPLYPVRLLFFDDETYWNPVETAWHHCVNLTHQAVQENIQSRKIYRARRWGRLALARMANSESKLSHLFSQSLSDSVISSFLNCKYFGAEHSSDTYVIRFLQDHLSSTFNPKPLAFFATKALCYDTKWARTYMQKVISNMKSFECFNLDRFLMENLSVQLGNAWMPIHPFTAWLSDVRILFKPSFLAFPAQIQGPHPGFLGDLSIDNESDSYLPSSSSDEE